MRMPMRSWRRTLSKLGLRWANPSEPDGRKRQRRMQRDMRFETLERREMLTATTWWDETYDGDVGGSYNGDPFTDIDPLPNENGLYLIKGTASLSDDQEAFNFTVPATFNFFGDEAPTILEAQGLFSDADGNGDTYANPLYDADIAAFWPGYPGYEDPIEEYGLAAGEYSFKGFEGLGANPQNYHWELMIEITGVPSTIEIEATDAVAHETADGTPQDLGQFTVTRDHDYGPLTIQLIVNGSSTASSGDYEETFPMNVEFAHGETSKTVSVTPVDDGGAYEGPETLIVDIASSSNYIIGTSGSATVTIHDNEMRYAQTEGTVIEQSETIYDGNRAVVYLGFQRFEDDTTTTGALDGSNSYRDASLLWYDLANRVTHSAAFGRDDDATNHYVWNSSDVIIDTNANGIPDIAEGAAYEPNQSADWIASKTEFDDAGRAFKTTDNLGRETHKEFDKLNRTVGVIENYVDGVVTETETDTDVTVQYVYDSSGRMEKLVAKNPKGSGNGVEDQETLYLFESEFNASWVTSTIYPDSSDTDSTGTDQVKTTYDRLGRTVTTVDQRGVEHTYEYDSAGRFSADKVTSLGSSGIVDDAILRIERTYDDMSRVATITSYDAATSGNVVNQVEYAYNGYQLVGEVFQEHDGAVDGSTKSVVYNYDDGASGGDAKYVRLESVEYPGTREVFYIYPGSGIGDVLNRVEAIADDSAGTTRLAEYDYLGAGTIVSVAHPEVNGGLTLDYNTNGDYEGWDTFGRVINQEWTNGAGTTTLDHYTYTYDYNSNRTSRDNELHSALDEDYTYDGMNRLIDTDRDGSAFQSWELDSLGNWNEFDDDGTVTDREHNEANELTTISGSTIDPTYDAAGNMISGPRPDSQTDRQHYVYDAWNRMVEALDDDNGTPDSTLITFEYDGRNYRIQKTGRGIAQVFYYNEGHQLLETQSSGSTAEEYVWDLRYIDAPILRETRGGILYFTNDANMNVTGLVDEDTGNVVERYHYDPYGKALYMDGSWTALMTQESAFDNVYLYTGRRLDVETALMYYRARYYDVALGRFTARDPIGYVDGFNLFGYVSGRPIGSVDPLGLQGEAAANKAVAPTGPCANAQRGQVVITLNQVEFNSATLHIYDLGGRFANVSLEDVTAGLAKAALKTAMIKILQQIGVQGVGRLVNAQFTGMAAAKKLTLTKFSGTFNVSANVTVSECVCVTERRIISLWMWPHDSGTSRWESNAQNIAFEIPAGHVDLDHFLVNDELIPRRLGTLLKKMEEAANDIDALVQQELQNVYPDATIQ